MATLAACRLILGYTDKRVRDIALLAFGVGGLLLLLLPILPMPFGQRLSGFDLIAGALSRDGGFNLWRVGLLALSLVFAALVVVGACSLLRIGQSHPHS